MTDFSKPYERTDIEYQPIAGNNPWEPAICKHCGEPTAYHWQTADHKIWCVRNTQGKLGSEK